MSEILETAGPYRVRLEFDQDASSCDPRDNDSTLSFAVTVPHSRYLDVSKPGPLANQWDRIKDRSDAMDLFERYARIYHGAVTDRVTPHDGPSSVWYILPEQIAEIGPSSSPEEALRVEIEEYRAWRDGEVYGYIIEKSVDWVRKDDEDEIMSTWEEVEDGSCWGFVGYKWAKEAALEEFKPYQEKVAAESK